MKKLTLFAGAFLMVLSLVGAALADKTNTWPFTVGTQYEISDSNLIEVASGVAKLKLQASTVGDVDLTDWLNASVTRESLVAGPDVLLVLRKSSGSTYAQQGSLESRVFDAGAGGGNRWDAVRLTAYNAQLLNAAGEITTNSAGLVLLDHMNNAWRNEVTGVAGTGVNNPVFTSRARLGVAATRFSGSYVSYDGPFALNSGMSVAFWINATNSTASYPIVAAFFNGATLLAYIRCGGSYSGGGEVRSSLYFMNLSGGGSAQTPTGSFGTADDGVWRHVVITCDPQGPAGGRLRFYKDGVELSKIGDNTPASFPTTPQIRLGGRTGSQAINGILDECAVWNRVLSPAEVLALYRMPRSVVVQCRSGMTFDEIDSKPFVGPDGTSASTYGGESLGLQNSSLFSRVDRFLQYKLMLLGEAGGTETPYVDAIGIQGSRVSGFDNVLGDFQQSRAKTDIDTMPAAPGTIGVGLDKTPNGGYHQVGSFLSRTFDGGASVFWDTFFWETSSGLEPAEPGLLGLWHMDGGWADGSGNGYNGSGITDVSYSSFAKLGSQSAVFNGSSSTVNIPLGSNGIAAVEFWLNSPNASGGLLDFGSGAVIRFAQRMVKVEGFSGGAPQLFVNGQSGSPFLPAGWNHVAVVWPAVITFPSLTIGVGRAGTEYYGGQMDELALYRKVKDGSSIKTHYLSGRGDSAGSIRFQVRAADVAPIPDSVGFVGPGNSPTAYFVSSGAGLPPDVWRKRYFQYKLIMEGDGSVSPVLNSVTVKYSGTTSGEAGDYAGADFAQGSFVDAKTRLVGAVLAPDDLALVPGLQNIDAVSAVALEGLWHMDELSWPTGPSVLDSSPFNRNGDPQNGATPVATARVGTMAGGFNGGNQYIVLPSITLSERFTVQGWVLTTSGSRAAMVSRDDGRLVLEVNGNGSGAAPGAVALVLSDGVTRRVAAAPGAGANDGRWHHLAGVRDGSQAYLYLDGVRVASVYLGAMGAPGLGQFSVARHGETGAFMGGYVDEIAVYSRALSDGEMLTGIAAGANISKQGLFVSKVFDAGGPAIWEAIAWEENGPFGDALASDASAVGLWSMDAIEGTTVRDASTRGNHGQTQGTTALAAGVFSNALSLAGAGGVTIPFADRSEAASLTVEAWVNLQQLADRVIVNRRSGADGYELATDASGLPYLAVGAAVCAAPSGLRPGVWTHLAGVYGDGRIWLFENGVCVASTNAGGSGTLPDNGYIGTAPDGTRRVDGVIDQVAIHDHALNTEEIADHARAGKGTLRFQGRAGNDPALNGAQFVGVGGLTNNFFDISDGSPMQGAVPLGRYFQYRAILSADYGWLAPRLQGVRIRQSRYSSDNPWVSPKPGFGATFLGKLLTFSHILQTNTDAAVRYQITGDSANWFWWNEGAAIWENVTGFGYSLASPVADINTHIGSFAKEHYDKTGGELRFRAYLHSEGNDQVAIDEVKSIYSEGRLTVLAPNGAETNKNALLTGVPYTIRWTSTGKVSNRLLIEYSRDGGATWPWPAAMVASNVPNAAGTNSYVWTVPQTIADQGLIRITDMQDPTVSDTSDSTFELVQRFRVLAPNGGEYWLTGTNNTIQWASAVFLGNKAKVSYAADGTNFNYLVSPPIVGTPNIEASASNSLVWIPPADDPALPSENARIRVETLGGIGSDDSDEPFVLAGLAFANPIASSYVNRRGRLDIAWTSAGAGTAVAFDYSTDDGLTWTNILANVPNQPGANVYSWIVGTPPSDFARMRCRSLNGNTNLVGLSQRFVVADVQVVVPDASTVWQAGSTNTIMWLAGGVGNLVNLYFSTNSGVAGSWVPIPGGASYPNISGSNTFSWVVPALPGAKTQVRVEALIDTNNLWSASADFKIAGVRIVSPNGGDLWTMGVDNAINWTYEAAGSDGTIYFAYDGVSFFTFPGGQRGLIDRQTVYTPTNPTARAKVKIVADNPAPFSNMFDLSDDFFTVGGIKVTAPTNGTLFTVGTTGNRISWTSAGSVQHGGDGFASIYYTTDTGVTSNFIARVGNNENYPGNNAYDWNMGLEVIPSETARIMIRSGGYVGLSEQFLLRGMKITSPVEGRVADLGSTLAIAWVFAGLDASARGYFYLSTDGGVTYPELIATNALNREQGSWAVSLKSYNWAIPMSTTPSTNAVLKFVITESDAPSDIGYAVRSPAFTLRGLKVQTPRTGIEWVHDSTNTIQVSAAVAGPFLSLYYSPDGVSYDFDKPVVQNRPLVSGLNSASWAVERFREPSGTARLLAVSALATNVSEPFGIRGVKVTNPLSTMIWAVGDSNIVSWAAYGTAGSYDVEIRKPTGEIIPIATGVTGNSVYWNVTADAVGSNVIVRVRDSGGYYGDSQPFRIVAVPTVVLVSPAAGDLWRVGDTNRIRWSRGGQMSNDFSVYYTTDPFATTTRVFTGEASYDPVLNMYSIPWRVEDSLGASRVIVQNNIRADVMGEGELFYIVGKFTFIYPNGGEQNIYALKPETITWYTEGSANFVNLFYSTDPLHGAGSWVRVNSTPIANYGRGTEPTAYNWTPANLQSETVRLRIEQSDRVGAYDDTDGDFAIRYYQILWTILDEATSNHLTGVSVTDSSGWSEASLNSPVLHGYPYGYFDTVWSKEYFFNNVWFNWKSEPSRTNTVWMKRSDIEPDYSVMANFVYDASNGVFRVNSWLQRRGRIVPTPSKCTIKLYTAAGTQVGGDLVSTAHSEGVFWQTLPNTLDRGQVYLARVEIEYSGVSYSSGVTFNLRVPTDQEQAQQMLNSLSNITAGVSTIDTNLNEFAALQAAFRGGVMAKLDNLSNNVAGLASLAGLSNLDLSGFRDLLALTNISEQLSSITNAVGVIGPNGTNLVDQMANLAQEMARRTARILTRPTSVKIGDNVDLLYRTYAGISASVVVTNLSTGAEVFRDSLRALTGGVYERSIGTATWTVGDYLITCYDTSGSSDSMVIRATRIDVDDLGTAMGSLTGQMARVERAVTNLAVSISNVQTSVNGVLDTIGGLSNLSEQVSVLTGAVATISQLGTSVEKILVLTNATVQLAAISTNVNQLVGMVGSINTNMSSLGGLSNVLAGVDWSNLVALASLGESVSNILTIVTETASNVVSGTGMSNALAGVDWTNLSALARLGGDVSTILSTVSNVYGMASNTYGVVTNIQGGGGTADLTTSNNAAKTLALVTDTKALVDKLTPDGATATAMTEVRDMVAKITAGGPQSNALYRSLANLESRLGNNSDGAGTETLFGRLAALDSSVGVVGETAELAAQKAGAARTEAENAKKAINQLKSKIGTVEVTKMSADLSEVRRAIEAARGQVEGVPGAVGKEAVEKITATLQDLNNKIAALSQGRVPAPVPGAPVVVSGGGAPGGGPTAPAPAPTAVGAGGGVTQEQFAGMLNMMAETKAMLEALRQLMDKEVNKPVVVDWLEGAQ